jgi:hypothetical protein
MRELRQRRYGQMVAPIKTQAKFSGALQLLDLTFRDNGYRH